MPGDKKASLSLERFAANGLKAQRAVDALMLIPRKSDLWSVSRPVADAELPFYVTADEIHLAVQHAEPSHGSLIAFLWATGARVSEALAVTPADLDIDRRMARVPTLKRRRKDGSGRKTSPARIVVVAGHWLNPVLGYIVQARRGPQDRIWPIGRKQAWRMISRVLQACGVPPGRARPHAIRHGHAVHAVKAGVPLNIIQRQLGHASIVTTSIYLRVTGQDVAQAYDRCDW